MTAPVTFDYAEFIASFPEFKGLTEPVMKGYFADADSFFVNSQANPAFGTGVERMTRLMYLMTAHLAWLFSPRDPLGNPSSTGQPSPAPVGQVTNASEGSVSVTMKAITNPGAEWYAQTRYGFAYWQGTAQFRKMLYIGATLPPVSSAMIYPPRWRGGWGR